MAGEFALYVVAGFLAQMVDGALGMAYGVSCNALLLSLGVAPAAASASVHAAEICTTFASGSSHLALGNVDKELFKRLVGPGVVGAVVGAVVLSQVPVDYIKPAVALYLVFMGYTIMRKALQARPPQRERVPHVGRLGLVGGFCDAVGGGGWGPIVTTTLIAKGTEPRTTIGSVNAAEFFVAVAVTVVLAGTLGVPAQALMVVGGLVLGGVVAAPLAAVTVRRVKPQLLMFLVGTLITALSFRNFVIALLELR